MQQIISPNHILHFRSRIDKVTQKIKKMTQKITPKPSKIQLQSRPKTDSKSGRQKNRQNRKKHPKWSPKWAPKGEPFRAFFATCAPLAGHGFQHGSQRPRWRPPGPQNLQILTPKCSKMEPIWHPKCSKMVPKWLWIPRQHTAAYTPRTTEQRDTYAPRRTPSQ